MVLIISVLMVLEQLMANSYMYNLYAIFVKYLDICKLLAGNLLNEQAKALGLPVQVIESDGMEEICQPVPGVQDKSWSTI